jgi:hypothetical protein
MHGRAIDYYPKQFDSIQKIIDKWKEPEIKPIEKEHWEQALSATKTPRLLAIGGPRSMDTLPDLGLNEYVVPLPVKMKFEHEISDSKIVHVPEVYRYFKYTLSDFNIGLAKEVWIGEDIPSPKHAEDILKQALLQLWLQQPYQTNSSN